MCVILDTNTFSKFKNPTDEDMEPVWKWLFINPFADAFPLSDSK